MRTIAGFLQGLVFLAFAASATFAEAAPPQLLLPHTGPQVRSNAPNVHSQAARIKFNGPQMRALKHLDEVELTLPNGKKHTVIFELAQDHGDGITSWVGSIKGRGNHNRVIITTGPGGSYGSVSTPEGEFRIIPGDGHDWLVDMLEETQYIPAMDLGDDALIAPPAAKSTVVGAAEYQVAVPGVNIVAVPKVTPTPQAVVDLMIVYTNGLADNLGANLMTRLNFLVTRANTSYADSEIAITLRLVRTMMVNYSDTVDQGTALHQITPGCVGGAIAGSCGGEAYDSATFSAVETQRTASGADLVAFVRNGSGFSGFGLAWIGSTAPNANFMYAVITGCVSACESVFIHEVGHNMGNRHDRPTTAWQAGGTATPPSGAFAYSFGYAFCNSGALTCNPSLVNGSGGGACTSGSQPECNPDHNNNFVDIMGYFQGTTEKIYKFSNPNILCAASVGDLVTHPCGISELAGNSANTALSMNNNRTALSAIKSSVVGASLPGSLQFTATAYSVTETGGSITVSVSRVGGSSGSVSVNYATVDGSARAGLDYTATSGTLTWANGDTANKSFSVPITNDGVTENGESFTVALSSPSGTTGVYLGHPSSVSVVIPAVWPLAGAMPSGWNSTATPAAPWATATDQAYEGTTSLRSFSVLSPDSSQVTYGNSDLTTPALSLQAGTISFAYRVSTYPSFGYLDFLIDGVVVFSDTDTSNAWKTAAVGVTAGTHTLTWRYKFRLNLPCANWMGAPVGCADHAWIDGVVLPVALATPSMIMSSGTTSTAGRVVGFTAVLSGVAGPPTGIVVFRDGSTPIPECAAVPVSGPTATCNTTSLTIGSHTITAEYSGDVNYDPRTAGPVTQVITAAVIKPGDFNASGTSDILIRDNTNGLVYGWLMNGLSISTGGYVLSAGSGWTPVRTLDLNGDSKADVLIQHTDGSLYAWIMDGLTVTTGGYLLGAGSGWTVSHTGDFNGDGKQDILLKHTDGSIYIWIMDGINILSGTYLQGAGTGWTATHVADFNGDGKSDVLLKHTDGSIYVWQMNGIAIQTGTFLKGAGIDWSPTETGDFNGDGKADILITHTNGGVYLWQMNGTVIQTGTYLMSPGSGWTIAKVGDLDGDGKSDIIIKHTDGSHYAWIMNGLSVTGGGYLLGAGTGWSVSHLLNLDSNNTMDILIKHTDGSIYAWLMSGATISNGAYLMGAGSWRVTP